MPFVVILKIAPRLRNCPHNNWKEPAFVSPHRYLKIVYFGTRDYPDYLAELRKEALLLHDGPGLTLANAAEKGFAAGGEKGLLESLRLAQKKLFDQLSASPFPLAETCARLGNRQEALQYLKVAYDRHDEAMIELEVDPVFASLRQDPAFRALVARVASQAKN